MSSSKNEAPLEYIKAQPSAPAQVAPAQLAKDRENCYLPEPSATDLSNVKTSPAAQASSGPGRYVHSDGTTQVDFFSQVEAKSGASSKFKEAVKSNPLVPIGCLVTIAILGRGIFAMKNKDKSQSQKMMRWRVGAQGATLLALIAGTMFTQWRLRNEPLE